MASKKELEQEVKTGKEHYERIDKKFKDNYDLAVMGEKEVKETRKKLRTQEDIDADMAYIQEHKKYGETKYTLLHDLLEEYRDKTYDLVTQARKDLDL